MRYSFKIIRVPALFSYNTFIGKLLEVTVGIAEIRISPETRLPGGIGSWLCLGKV
jgi:hypothetical protein